MSTVDNLINDDAEAFRNEIYTSLYNKVKEKLQNKKIEIASSLYDIGSDEECEECKEQN